MKSPDRSEEDKAPRPRRATVEETNAAMKALTDVQLLKLGAAARKLTRGGVLKGGHDELLQSAFNQTLENLNWYIDLNPTIFEHLRWKLRYLANEGGRKLTVEDPATGKRVPRMFNPETDENNFWENLEQENNSVEDDMINQQLIARIFEFFADDQEAYRVIESWHSGYNGPDTVKALGLTKQQYEKIKVRIRRKAGKLKERNYVLKK